MLERNYQPKVIKRLKAEFPGCVVLKNDPNYLQGFPDLTVLHGKKWVALETKRSKDAKRQPNQEYYVSTLNGMSYASFISPENESEVFREIHRAFQS